jgi:hypothetical protein
MRPYAHAPYGKNVAPLRLFSVRAAKLAAETFPQRPHLRGGRYGFQQACRMGLECVVSKRLSAPYRSGPSRDWLKIKNPASPAMLRHREGSARWR